MALLEHEPDEQQRLVQELLISVTGFFRDPEIYDPLAAQLAGVVRQAAAEDRELRAWVAGCATGEEAYTLAIALQRVAEREQVPLRLRLFATDIDAPALEIARRGVYAASAWTSRGSAPVLRRSRRRNSTTTPTPLPVAWGNFGRASAPRNCRGSASVRWTKCVRSALPTGRASSA